MTSSTAFHVRTNACVVVAAAMLLAAAADSLAGPKPPAASTIRVKPRAMIAQPPVRLGDVLDLSEADSALAERVGSAVLDEDESAAPPRRVGYAAIAERIEALGVNPMSVLLSGASACELTIATPTQQQAPTEHPAASRVRDAQPRASTAADPFRSEPHTADAAGDTLADAVRAFVDAELKRHGGHADLEFERAEADSLELTSPPWDFSVRGAGGNGLGLRQFRVVIRKDGKIQRAVDVAARVRMARDVLVAARPLSIGNYISENDLVTQRRLFDALEPGAAVEPGELVGKQAARYVPAGEPVTPDAVKLVDLVQRSRPVTVLSGGDNVQMRLSGVALDSGAIGEVIRLRLGDGRNARRQVYGVVVGQATVRLQEGS